MTTSAHEPGRTAYEARFAGHTLGPRGVAEAWEDLLPVHQAIWARVEEVVINAALTAKLAQAEGEIATAQEALRLAEGPLSWLARDLHGSAVVARALAAVRTALTTPEHPHGD